MKVELMNMCMVHDLETDRVLVLDKVKKEGWEGLTFPGGHVETFESFYQSVAREVEEETGLLAKDFVFKGFIQWIDEEKELKQVGLLYYSSSFTGKLVDETEEGKVFWMDLKEFIKAENKSWSMDDIMKIYMDNSVTEAVSYLVDDKLSEFTLF